MLDEIGIEEAQRRINENMREDIQDLAGYLGCSTDDIKKYDLTIKEDD